MDNLVVNISLTKRNYKFEARLELNSYSNALELNFENDSSYNFKTKIDITEEELKEFIVWAFKRYTKKRFDFTDLSFSYEYNCTEVHTISLDDCLEFWQLDEKDVKYPEFIMDAALEYVGNDFEDALSLIQGEYSIYDIEEMMNEYLVDAIPDKDYRDRLWHLIDKESLKEDLTTDYHVYEDYAIEWL